jgi:hypothetical protein
MASMIRKDNNDLSELVFNRHNFLEPSMRAMKGSSDKSIPLIEDPSYSNPLILNKGKTLRGRDLLEV